MAVAKTRTMLSLDRYAQIIGLNPVHFNGGSDIQLASGKILYPLDNAQNDIWSQYDWQSSDQVGREQLAMVIADAEEAIVRELGYFPTPMWIEEEFHPLARHHRPEATAYTLDFKSNSDYTSVMLERGYFIQGGRRASTVLEDGATVTYSDPNADGWDELATITYAVPATITDLSQIKVYFAGYSGDRAYEIRPARSITYAGGVMTFQFPAYMMVNPEVWEVASSNELDGKTVDMNDPSVFVTTVDIYREYNDTSSVQALFFEEGFVGGIATTTTQEGFLLATEDSRFVQTLPGTYSAETGWTLNRITYINPDYVKVWYYSGMKDIRYRKPYTDDYLSNKVERAIAYLATARLDKMFYSNTGATSKFAHYQEDLTTSSKDEFRFVPDVVLKNPFGFRRGEVDAWREISSMKKMFRGGAL